MTGAPEDLDKALAQTFPASDPPAAGSPTVAVAPDAEEAGPWLSLYRLVDEAEAEGAFAPRDTYPGGRWSHADTPMVYATTSESLATLEYLAHLEGRTPQTLVLVSARVPERLAWADPPLPAEWHRVPHDPQVRDTGDRWARESAQPVILVPSVHAHSESNALVLPLHAQARRIQVVSRRPVALDPRLRT